MGKSRTSKTMAAGMALGLTAYSKQFGCRKGGMAEIAAPQPNDEADAERQKQTGAWQERKLGVEVKSMDCPYCDYIHDCTEDCEECEIYDDYLDDINDLY